MMAKQTKQIERINSIWANSEGKGGLVGRCFNNWKEFKQLIEENGYSIRRVNSKFSYQGLLICRIDDRDGNVNSIYYELEKTGGIIIKSIREFAKY